MGVNRVMSNKDLEDIYKEFNLNLKDFLPNSELKPLEMLDKIKDMCEINTRVNWDGQWMEKEPVTPNEEFQNITDIIDKYLISKK